MRVVVEKWQHVRLYGSRARQGDLYDLEELADGTIILRPLATLPQAELEALKNPGVQRSLEENQQVGGVVSGSAEVF